MLNVAVRAARAAGRIITRASHDLEKVRVASKQRNDFVTEVDQAAENAIITTLQQAYPSQGIQRRKATLPRKTPSTSGSLILWTAPPTSFTACHSTRSRSH
jgi:fructose-1,6-bisphosphatase/inositol monophosphatase family enzyme